jgi:hypothetical protein
MTLPPLPETLQAEFEQHTKLHKAFKALQKILEKPDFTPMKAHKALASVRKEAAEVSETEDYFAQLEEAITERERHIKSHIGRHIHEALQAEGLSLAGQYPRFQCSFFYLELNIAKDQATLWYGPEQEKLAQVKHNAPDIAEAILKARRKLAHAWTEDDFLAQLRSSYKALLAQVGPAESLPLIDLLAQIAFDLSRKDKHFSEDPRPRYFADYGRENFSYDLFRTREKRAYSLRVATRLDTRQRSGYLWIPKSESTEGTTFASISMEV